MNLRVRMKFCGPLNSLYMANVIGVTEPTGSSFKETEDQYIMQRYN